APESCSVAMGGDSTFSVGIGAGACGASSLPPQATSAVSIKVDSNEAANFFIGASHSLQMGSAQSLHVGGDGVDLLVGHVSCDITHHAVGIGLPRARSEGAELSRDVSRMLSLNGGIERGRVAEPARSVTARARGNVCVEITAAIE